MAPGLVQAARKEGLSWQSGLPRSRASRHNSSKLTFKAQVILTIGKTIAAGTVQAKHPASGKQVTLPLDQVFLKDLWGLIANNLRYLSHRQVFCWEFNDHTSFVTGK